MMKYKFLLFAILIFFFNYSNISNAKDNNNNALILSTIEELLTEIQLQNNTSSILIIPYENYKKTCKMEPKKDIIYYDLCEKAVFNVDDKNVDDKKIPYIRFRAIVYNTNEISQINDKWSLKGLLAHELSHCLNNDNVFFINLDLKNRKELEKQADIFSGYLLHLNGANIREAKSWIDLDSVIRPSCTFFCEDSVYASKSIAKEYIELGWNKYENIIKRHRN